LPELKDGKFLSAEYEGPILRCQKSAVLRSKGVQR
jgi:hypothetical protein